jgi:DNA invertase Pin-like site-specific DNA recombinase
VRVEHVDEGRIAAGENSLTVPGSSISGSRSWVAEQERTRLIERTKAGLERARRDGKRLGRIPASPVKVAAALARISEGASIREAAKAVGLNRETVRRAAAAARVAACH